MKSKSIFTSLIFAFNICTAKNNCDEKHTPIHSIQGSGQNSELVNQQVWVKGIVTGDFRGKERLGGYFIQSLKADNDVKSSEGLFIQENNLELPFNLGDVVVTYGEVIEQFGVTQIKHAQHTKVCMRNQKLPEPFKIQLPLDDLDLENIEGMRVTLASPHAVINSWQLMTYGEFSVASKLLMNPTSVVQPGEEARKLDELNRRNQLIIDDGSTQKYPKPLNEKYFIPNKIDANNMIKVGQRVSATGVMHYLFGNYKIQPTEMIQLMPGLETSGKTPKPHGGDLSIATFNVENFFTTIDNGKEICGPLKDFSCRGADNAKEFERQLAKLVHTINVANASVLGLQELENNKKSIKALVKGLNKAVGFEKWRYIDTGVLGEDAIKVGLIYQPELVKPKGEFALLNKKSDPAFKENRNRIIVAQTFADVNDNAFNVATVHFKSKSCRDAEEQNLNQEDGQGCYNPVRFEVAGQLSNWLNTDPTKQEAKATFIVGDFNSYQQEDPMTLLASNGFVNLADSYLPKENFTAGFRGTMGSLDYVLANEEAKQLTTGLVQWHINSVSTDDFGYNNEAFDKGIERPKNFYAVNPFKSSDHDVVIAGLSFK